MKKLFVALLAAGALPLAACTTTPEDQEIAEGAAIGAGVGAVAGAGAGAVIGGLSPIEGAVIGAAAGGLIGAVWADRDNDGRADGYYHNGQYYEGRPPQYHQTPPPPDYQPASNGERG